MKRYSVNPLSGELQAVEDFSKTFAPQEHAHPLYAPLDARTGKLLPDTLHDILAEYSADGEGWHREPLPEDRYLRLSSSGGARWSAPLPLAAQGAPAWVVDEALMHEEGRP